jgi:chromosomal replication initiation ATPase DnaA
MSAIAQLAHETILAPSFAPPPRPSDDAYDEEERRAAVQRFLAGRRDHWQKICPPEFLDTQPDRLAPPAREALAVRIPRDAVGLLFCGPTGCGKSRTAWLKAQRIFLARDVGFRHATGIDLADDILAAYEDGSIRSLRDDLRDADLLLLDDLFKGAWKPSVEAMVFNVLDYRVAWRKPTIVTTNSDGKGIAKMLSADVKAPFLRRIGPDFFRTFLFDKKPLPE